MKLKTPLFLILIAGTICIFIFLIWPDFSQISIQKESLKKSQEVVDGIQRKNANAGSLIASLNAEQNASQKEFVFNYIPLARKEEKIFNSLNNLAKSDGVNVVLGNVSLETAKEAAAPNPEVVQTSKDIIFDNSGTGNAGELSAPASVLPQERVIKAKMSVSGKYENIKSFIGKLYALDMMKNISALKLASVKNETGATTENITAEIVADFGYIPEARINRDYDSPVFGKNKFDFALVDNVKNLLLQKAEAVAAGGAGRSNPFLP